MSADDTPLNSFQSDDCSHQLLTTPLSEAVVPIAKIARAASGVVGKREAAVALGGKAVRTRQLGA
jgi:hypothetical protein